MKNRFKLLVLPILSFLLLSCSNSSSTEEEKENQAPVNETTNNGEENNQNSHDGSENNNNDTPIDNTPTETKLNPMDEPYIGRQYYLNHIGDIYSAWK